MKFDRVGLVMVHGIGDQAPREHLQDVADNIARTAAMEYGTENVSVKINPGFTTNDLSEIYKCENHTFGDHSDVAHASIIIKLKTKVVVLDLHEVWWRDLGQRPTISSYFRFWLWAISFPGTRGLYNTPEGDLLKNPANPSAMNGSIKFKVRARLFFKTAGIFVLLLPFHIMIQIAALIPFMQHIHLFRTFFTYLSSVQLYVERAEKTSGTVEDYSQTRRQSIQRRMVNTMACVSKQGYDRWYILAHSLGSVIAHKALNMQPTGFARLLNIEHIIGEENIGVFTEGGTSNGYIDEPKCPVWLTENKAVDFSVMLKNLKGLITYGSPLETFAHVWPAIVPVSTDTRFESGFECVFRGKSATDSDGSRPPIPIQVGHLFRLIPATP